MKTKSKKIIPTEEQRLRKKLNKASENYKDIKKSIRKIKGNIEDELKMAEKSGMPTARTVSLLLKQISRELSEILDKTENSGGKNVC